MTTSKTLPAPLDRETEKAITELQRQLHGLQESRAGAIRVQNRDSGIGEQIKRFDREIDALLARLRELRPATPAEQLTALEISISATDAELGQLGERKIAAIEAKLKQEPEAAQRLQQIEEQIKATESRRTVLRQQHGQVRERIAAARAADRRKAAEETPLRLAELHREHAALADTINVAARSLASAFAAMQTNNAAIAELTDDQSARNFFSAGAFRRRAMNSFARSFALNPNAPLTAGNSLFGVASDAIGTQAHWTLLQWERPGLDNLVPFFVSEADAEAARQRQELEGCQTIVVALHNAFTLVPFGRVFGDEATARRAAAKSATPLAVVAHDRGFVLIPHRFAGEAA